MKFFSFDEEDVLLVFENLKFSIVPIDELIEGIISDRYYEYKISPIGIKATFNSSEH